MITEKDFLKSVKRMNDKEKQDYSLRIQKWTDETYPRLCALADAWTAADVKDFDEGLIIASAFYKARGFINVAMRYDAKRRLKKLNELLIEVRERSGLSKVTVRRADDRTAYKAVVQVPMKVDDNGEPVKPEPFKLKEVDGRRPEHLSQYADRLDPLVRKATAELEPLYLLLSQRHAQLHFLSDDPNAAQQDIAFLSSEVVETERRILRIWRLVDVSYNLATGKEVEEEDENWYHTELATLETPDQDKKWGEYTKEEIDRMPEGELKKNITNARIEANKRYFRRRDILPDEKYKAQMKRRMREMLDWGVQLTPSALAFIQEQGIVLEDLPAATETLQGQTQAMEPDGVKPQTEENVSQVQQSTLRKRPGRPRKRNS